MNFEHCEHSEFAILLAQHKITALPPGKNVNTAVKL